MVISNTSRLTGLVLAIATSLAVANREIDSPAPDPSAFNEKLLEQQGKRYITIKNVNGERLSFLASYKSNNIDKTKIVAPAELKFSSSKGDFVFSEKNTQGLSLKIEIVVNPQGELQGFYLNYEVKNDDSGKKLRERTGFSSARIFVNFSKQADPEDQSLNDLPLRMNLQVDPDSVDLHSA